MESDSVMSYNLTSDQVETICKHYNKEVEEVEDYQVAEMLDDIIDNLN